MKIIESPKVKEKAYIEVLDNGLKIIIIPKKNAIKKYVIWGTHFGSIDNRFIMPKTGEEVFIPDGVAHFLEHKMFEQKNGTNSLDTLMAMGIDANAYTTNDHTAYLFECTDNFYDGLTELMDYIQNPYFTDENVEKEKGIIAQEIKMYDDDPSWRLYINLLDCLYENNPIKIDIAGTVESISQINPDVLYKCYDTFYNPANMTMVICGDFEPEKILEEVKSRIIEKENLGEIKRIYPKKEEKINKSYKEEKMEISTPIFAIGYKDTEIIDNEIIRKNIAIKIILNLVIGKSSDLYKKLYESGELIVEPTLDYEFAEQYAHIIISGQTNSPEMVLNEFKQTINNFKKNGFDSEYFERIKKKVYGQYVIEYNSVSDIARMFLMDSMKNLNSFDYIEEYDKVTKEYTEQVLKRIFNEDNLALSVVK